MSSHPKDSSVSNRSFSFTFRQHVSGSTPIGALGIGTPSIALNMILDTGSDKFVAKTWATIKAELEKILGRSTGRLRGGLLNYQGFN